MKFFFKVTLVLYYFGADTPFVIICVCNAICDCMCVFLLTVFQKCIMSTLKITNHLGVIYFNVKISYWKMIIQCKLTIELINCAIS